MKFKIENRIKLTLISNFMLCISDLALRNSNSASSRSFSAFPKIFVIFPEGENPFACLRRRRCTSSIA